MDNQDVDTPKARVRIGCAGWGIPHAHASEFGATGSNLERYAATLDATEINSTFYRVHRQSTFEKWAASVPDSFRFSVKMPREITHRRRLVDCAELLTAFLAEIKAFGAKLGPVLVQLPPSLAYDQIVAHAFFDELRAQHNGPVVCEPRHATWFDAPVDHVLAAYRIARVAADPVSTPAGRDPGGWTELVYYRLHGSPRLYYSPYDEDAIQHYETELRRRSHIAECWCIFDNTASGAAAANAIELQTRLRSASAISLA